MTDAPFTHPAAPWLLFAHLPRCGAGRRRALLDHHPDLPALLATNAATLKSAGLAPPAVDLVLAWQRRDLHHNGVQKLVAIWRACADQGVTLMTWADADYPEPLRHIHDAPVVLYLRGERALLQRPQIGVVGSRNASRSGLAHARNFAAVLSERGYLVTSGLALGIDGAAHLGALNAGYPTVAVIGTGVDVIYPRQHADLTRRIIESGVLVSDLPPGAPPRAAHFPQRNRIISGLSRGVLVVEASRNSGSLITARLALEQGREVFAIPGSVHNPVARGCHDLIRQGAVLVESVTDIEDALAGWQTRPVSAAPQASRASPQQDAPSLGPEPLPAQLDDREIAVLSALGYDSLSTDELCLATGLPADQLVQALLLLEMQGLVEAAPGGYQRIHPVTR
ncbi:DNA-processing protein DprA [Marinobacter sp. X15-166B]|uniref:DNA-processing protein DprA n=1 Tax=Marinobacter sp. X15-166B TaxID=1897620 RepID=UPI00085C9ECF|nr:DNA-processing protein DprA [Marinobacter sp. X15-166B]OEY66147.1 DNA protecting protein DprA [Marinobacter sp. X15-166B]